MAAALECWSGRPSTDEDVVEQVLMKSSDRSEMLFPPPSTSPSSSSSSAATSPSHPSAPPNPKKWQRLGRNLASTLSSLKNNLLDSSPAAAAASPNQQQRRNAGGKLPFGLCGCQADDEADDRLFDSDQIHLPSPLPESSVVVAVDEWQAVRSGGDEVARWMLGPNEVEFADQTGPSSFRGVCRGKRVWIKRVRGCERGSPYEFELRRDLLQLMTCGHRNILQFVGVCIDEGNGLCVAVRMMEGGSVHDSLQRGRKKGAREAARIALDVAEGLMFMNSHGVAYRDLNAQRILLDRQGNAFLGDMGIVTSGGNAGEVTEYETAGFRLLAPEIIAGDPETVTETWMSNVYSFGMVVWEMVTGEAAYSSYSPVQAAVGIAACGLRPEIPRDCPQVLRSLMMKCWNNCPSKRPRFSEIISILRKQTSR